MAALHTFPDLFAGRLAHIFVDNEAAKSNLISGYSPHPDSARVVHEYHLQVARLACYPWLSFVYSQDNIADLPSRGEFTKLAELGSVSFDIVWPDLGASWSASFASAYNLYARKPGKAALRLRRAISQATESLRKMRL